MRAVGTDIQELLKLFILAGGVIMQVPLHLLNARAGTEYEYVFFLLSATGRRRQS